MRISGKKRCEEKEKWYRMVLQLAGACGTIKEKKKEEEKEEKRSVTSERMRARGAGDWFPAGSRAEPLRGCWRLADSGGRAPLRRLAARACKTRMDWRRGRANAEDLPRPSRTRMDWQRGEANTEDLPRSSRTSLDLPRGGTNAEDLPPSAFARLRFYPGASCSFGFASLVGRCPICTNLLRDVPENIVNRSTSCPPPVATRQPPQRGSRILHPSLREVARSAGGSAPSAGLDLPQFVAS